jgi:hypothetical protein
MLFVGALVAACCIRVSREAEGGLSLAGAECGRCGQRVDEMAYRAELTSALP